MTINNHHTPPLEAFSFDEARQLCDTVSAFLKDRLGIISLGSKPRADESDNDDGARSDFITLFEIRREDAALPVYKRLDSPARLPEIIEHINELIRDMSDAIGRVLETYEDEMGDRLQAVEMIHSLTRRFNKALNKRAQLLTFETDSSGDDLEAAFFDFLRKIVDENLLARIIPSVYEGMRSGDVDLYQLVLKPINIFLARLGIHTLPCRAGDKMDYDFATPLAAEDNVTHDFKLKEVVKEVKQYPYVFDSEHVVSEGTMVVWRFTNE